MITLKYVWLRSGEIYQSTYLTRVWLDQSVSYVRGRGNHFSARNVKLSVDKFIYFNAD